MSDTSSAVPRPEGRDAERWEHSYRDVGTVIKTIVAAAIFLLCAVVMHRMFWMLEQCAPDAGGGLAGAGAALEGDRGGGRGRRLH